jgi:hypothetical protein
MNHRLSSPLSYFKALRLSLLGKLPLALAIIAALATAGSLARTADAGSAISSLGSVRAVVAGPTLGNYPNTTVSMSGNITVTPDAAPTGVTSINVSTNTNFKGRLTANPATGVVRVTDAHPSGTYTVTVTAFDNGVTVTSKTFQLTVQVGTACGGTGVFTSASDVGMGSQPFSIELGDFNNDGKQDFVTANSNSTTVSVRLGDGAGNFSGTTEVSVGNSPRSIAIGDFNNDGNQDLAVSNSTNVSIRLGDGAGNFSNAPDINVGPGASVVVGDFNNDGKQDLAIANATSNNVSFSNNVWIRLGDGAGNFSNAPDVSVGALPASIAIGDFNNDGKQDLAVANNFSNSVSIRLGDGAGNFSGSTSVSTGSRPLSIALGDFNNDGKQDFITANQFSNDVSIQLGDGAGNFSGTTHFRIPAIPEDVAVGDFNNDGKQDFIVPNGDGNFLIGWGDGAGGFTTIPIGPVGVTPLSVAVGDFNGDGKQDVAIANAYSNNVSIRLGGCAPAVQLSASAYSVSEGSQHATVTVTRTGDLSQASSVDYTTWDRAELTPCSDFTRGDASQRCDYTMTVGTLRFAAGESAKTIFIPIEDDSYFEFNEIFFITLSNPVGAGMFTPASAMITITDNDAPNSGNPLTGSQFFIRQLYMDFLGREPEPAGMQGWLDVLNKCGTTVAQPCDRIEVAADFFRSEEFQQRGYFIYRTYRMLGRAPLYSEFMPDFAKVSGFLTAAELEANKTAFVQEFMTRAEFKAKYDPTLNNPTAYVDLLLQTTNLPNHPSRTTWINGLTNQTLTRGQVLRALIDSAEMYNKYYNEAFVVEMYFGFLRRDPDALYLQWIQTLNQTGDYRTLVSGFLNSNEFAQRFGP